MPQISFASNNRSFHIELNDRVKQYFKDKNISQRGNAKLFFKAFFMYAVVLSCYAVLVFVQPSSVLLNIALLVVFGTFLAFIGFNVMHDSCHGAFSNNSKVNDVFGYSMNFLGAECRFWKVKHNVLHHTYTNVDGVDDDIFKPQFLRMSPNQPYLPLHKYQSWYMLFLYGISTMFWVFWMDSLKYFTDKVHTTDLPKKKMADHISFWATKLFYIGFYIVTPLVFLGFSKFIFGFFFFNWHPSRMYMGDTGSQFLGVFLAAISIMFFWNIRTPYIGMFDLRQFVIPLLLFIIPLCDTGTVVIRRLARRQSPFVGGKDHIAHHLAYLGMSDTWVAVLLGSVSLASVGIVMFIYP
jgi:hypothetical protein